MQKIGITGGVGAGKSVVLAALSGLCNCVVMKADQVAHLLEQQGGVCFNPLVELLGNDVLGPDGEIDKGLMAARIFADDEVRLAVNGIVHPAVKQYVIESMKTAEAEGYDYFFLEAALLIEDHYDLILDEMWYVRADEDVRIERLARSRGYSEEKSRSIIRSQRTDLEFARYASQVITNNGSTEQLKEQLEKLINRQSR